MDRGVYVVGECLELEEVQTKSGGVKQIAYVLVGRSVLKVWGLEGAVRGAVVNFRAQVPGDVVWAVRGSLQVVKPKEV